MAGCPNIAISAIGGKVRGYCTSHCIILWHRIEKSYSAPKIDAKTWTAIHPKLTADLQMYICNADQQKIVGYIGCPTTLLGEKLLDYNLTRKFQNAPRKPAKKVCLMKSKGL